MVFVDPLARFLLNRMDVHIRAHIVYIGPQGTPKEMHANRQRVNPLKSPYHAKIVGIQQQEVIDLDEIIL